MYWNENFNYQVPKKNTPCYYYVTFFCVLVTTVIIFKVVFMTILSFHNKGNFLPKTTSLAVLTALYTSPIVYAELDSQAFIIPKMIIKPSVLENSQQEILEHKDCTQDDWVTRENGILTGAQYNSANEVALLDAGNEVTYGEFNNYNQKVGFRECELKSEKVIKIPVLMVDWADFDPATDMSNPNNPDSIEGNEYKQRTIEEVKAFLNSGNSIAKYFKDVSGGKFKIEFEVFDWLRSSDDGSLIKPRSEYLSISEYDGRWYCDRNQVMKDVLKEAILNKGLDPNDYDINHNLRNQNEGLMNGAVLLYEGGPGSCSGYNMSWLEIGSFEPGEHVEKAVLNSFNLNELIVENPEQQQKLSALNKVLRVYNNIPEKSVYGSDYFGWAHELGHMFLGFPDYYYEKFNMGYFALSARTPSLDAFSPAGFEKWLFAKWIEPQELTESTVAQITSHDIADDAQYDSNTPYLYKHNIDGNPEHYLLIENRWFENSGNIHSSWVKQDPNYSGARDLQSGLQIFEVNLKHGYYNDKPSVYRYSKTSDPFTSQLESWAEGNEFKICYGTYCIELSDISAVGQEMSFSFSAFTDTDGDGIADENDAFPNDSNEWLDTDGDGIGNNADADDDNDGVVDTNDAFPLDSAESVDTDGDGIGNNADTDDDNDGVVDTSDAFPLDATRSTAPTPEVTKSDSSGGSLGGFLALLMLFLTVKRSKNQKVKK